MIYINLEEDIPAKIEGKFEDIYLELCSLNAAIIQKILEDKGVEFATEILTDMYKATFEAVTDLSLDDILYLKEAEDTLEN